jgi:hypothetical protein
VGDREPVLDHLDAGAHQHLFELGHGAEELFILLVRAEAHHAFDAGAVVPAAVEQHDLAGGGQVCHVALEVPLGAFAVVGRGQRRHAADARVQALRDALDHAALAGSVASFEDDDDLVPGGGHPALQPHQFALQAEQLAEIVAAAVLLGLVVQVHRIAEGLAGFAVVQFQFDLFVVVVGHLVVDAPHQLCFARSHLICSPCGYNAVAAILACQYCSRVKTGQATRPAPPSCLSLQVTPVTPLD